MSMVKPPPAQDTKGSVCGRPEEVRGSSRAPQGQQKAVLCCEAPGRANQEGKGADSSPSVTLILMS